MTTRDRLLVSGLAVLGVLAAMWFVLVAPVRSESTSLDAQVATARTQRDDAVRQSAAVVAAQRDRASDSAAIAALGAAVPTSDQTASLLYQLDVAAGRSRVTLESITPSPAAAGTPAAAAVTALPGGVTPAPLSLNFRGRFADLKTFLRRVERHVSLHGDAIRVRGRLVTIKGVHLTADAENPGRVQATLDAEVYTAASTPPAPATSATPAPSGGSSAAVAPPTQPAAIGVGG